MITPAEFPYITSIHVNDCYTYQDFDIDLVKHQPFSHLILTGKNGSGKSTILKEINRHLDSASKNIDLKKEIGIAKESVKIADNYNDEADKNKSSEYHMNHVRPHLMFYGKSKQIIDEFGKVEISYANKSNVLDIISEKRNKIILSYLEAKRNSSIVNKVESPSKQENFEMVFEQGQVSSDFFVKNFKQFLVNKKVNQAFAQLKNNQQEVININLFFEDIKSVFSDIFEDNGLNLVFIEDNYEFFIELSDGRKLTFDILPDGFSAFLSILMDLFTRLDLIRKSVGNFTYDPCGIVLIDEPETHLHLSLQYQVLPILTKLFPNVQFIVATHSPAVISSIKNVTVFDLTSKEVMSDEAVGKSFSELMVSHFGLDNEFSSITDEIFDEFNTVLRENRKNIPLRNEKIKQLMQKHGKYISPTMSLELEAMLSESE